jgi:hypothetical protein
VGILIITLCVEPCQCYVDFEFGAVRDDVWTLKSVVEVVRGVEKLLFWESLRFQSRFVDTWS